MDREWRMRSHSEKNRSLSIVSVASEKEIWEGEEGGEGGEGEEGTAMFVSILCTFSFCFSISHTVVMSPSSMRRRKMKYSS